MQFNKGVNMIKYDNLEQAMKDPAVVIITEDITSLRELNRIYVTYKVLSKKQRRISNYYSNRFTGHTVPEMYDLLKDRLRAEYDLFKDLQLPNESFVVSEPDLYYKGETSMPVKQMSALFSAIRAAENPVWQERWKEIRSITSNWMICF